MARLLRNWCGLNLVLGIGSFHGSTSLAVDDTLSIGWGNYLLCLGEMFDNSSKVRRQLFFFLGSSFLFHLFLDVETKLEQQGRLLFEEELFVSRSIFNGLVALVDAHNLVDVN